MNINRYKNQKQTKHILVILFALRATLQLTSAANDSVKVKTQTYCNHCSDFTIKK